MKLHIGAGDDIKEGWVNHDVAPLAGIDVVHNLSVVPWPWASESVDEIYMKDVLEHVPDVLKVMEELYRICKPGAKLYISVPYWNSYESVTDPTHINQFNEFTFEFFDPTKVRCQRRPYYTNARFEIKRLGYGIKILQPYVRIPLLSRYRVVYNPVGKWFLGFFASIFNNVIHCLEVDFEKK